MSFDDDNRDADYRAKPDRPRAIIITDLDGSPLLSIPIDPLPEPEPAEKTE